VGGASAPPPEQRMTKKISPLFLKRPIKKLSIDWRDDALYLNNFLHSSDSKVTIGLLPLPAASVFWAYHEVQGRDQVFHNCLTICQWIKRYDCNNICNFDSVRNKRRINVSCWTSWFDKLWWWCQMLGKCISGIRISKILVGRTQTPAWASQLRCSQGRALLDMVCPLPQAKNPSYTPATWCRRETQLNHPAKVHLNLFCNAPLHLRTQELF